MPTKMQLTEALGAVPLFEQCTKRDRRAIARHLETLSVPAGTTLVFEGDPGETFYLILSGELLVEQGGRTTATLGPNDGFGELSLLDPAPRSATVTASTDAEVGALSMRLFLVLLRDMPHVSRALLASLARQLRLARERI